MNSGYLGCENQNWFILKITGYTIVESLTLKRQKYIDIGLKLKIVFLFYKV